jgi:hypothetical protein
MMVKDAEAKNPTWRSLTAFDVHLLTSDSATANGELRIGDNTHHNGVQCAANRVNNWQGGNGTPYQ